MTNSDSAQTWMEEAAACLKSARSLQGQADWRGVAQQAQQCVEDATKAVIACFGSPHWKHDSSVQLRGLLKENSTDIQRRVGVSAYGALHDLATSAAEAAPWHGWSVYGKNPGTPHWVPPSRLCTQEVAQRLMELAEPSYETARRFTEAWTKG
ncbi:MAG: HEPN domain-containing protein [Planctomycetes bacterium]|nr:HEPN domain-containing protein [Planctomycetota bacterium]